VKTVLLDANELARDFLCTGLPYQLLYHMPASAWSVCVSAVVFEETVANYERALEDMRSKVAQLTKPRRRLGLPPIELADAAFDYRSYLSERFDEQLGITILPWPQVSHQDLVKRAVQRSRPFDERGSGYRDSLIWADVVKLAEQGCDVVLVSLDKAFAGSDGRLSPELEAEIAPLAGTAELVRDFPSWLVSEVPWQVDDLRSAIAQGRDEQFWEHFVYSDFQSDIYPDIDDLGFKWTPYHCEIIDVEWGGLFEVIRRSDAPDGTSLVEYAVDYNVEFEAEFPEAFEPEPGWTIELTKIHRAVRANGSIRLIIRIAVLFGGEFGFSVEQLSWRRADGDGPGFPVYRPELDPNQLSIFAAMGLSED
jgi:hypothetical protein